MCTLKLPGGQTINTPNGIPCGGIDVTSNAIGNAITLMLIIAVILSLIFIIIGGLQWIQSGGDKQKVAKARARITYAIIGLIVAFVSFFIINIVGFIFHVKLI